MRKKPVLVDLGHHLGDVGTQESPVCSGREPRTQEVRERPELQPTTAPM